LILATQWACGPSVRQEDFASAEEAVQALIVAASSDYPRALLEVLGEQAEPMLISGDPVQDKNSRERFLSAYTQAHALIANGEGRATLEVGTDRWPFPFPIIQRKGRWQFDSTAGAEEIVNRRVGANELATIQSCLAFVDAQREYYLRNPERDPLQHYAQKLVSTEGRKDGLYWPTTGDEASSPLGEAFARARGEGYFEAGASKATPFHGYVYRLLLAQGPNAAGGDYQYVVHDQMLGGFGLIASPAEYGQSGVMTFIVNHEGVVYSKDLGSDTDSAARAIESFDPDHSWKQEGAIH
jgi:hypothetical protein